jgi:hypothetical protein
MLVVTNRINGMYHGPGGAQYIKFLLLPHGLATFTSHLLGLAGPKYGGVLGMPVFKRLPVLCVPPRSGPQRGMPHEPTATRSKFHAPVHAEAGCSFYRRSCIAPARLEKEKAECRRALRRK